MMPTVASGSSAANELTELSLLSLHGIDICGVLQCVAVCCSVLQCVAACYNVLQCVAVCCSVLQCVAVCCSVLQSVAVCCSVFQCVLVCCSEHFGSSRPMESISAATSSAKW